MSFKLLSLLGVVASFVCLGIAALLYPGGYDWGRDYVSTLLRAPAGPARTTADAAVLLYCTSLALVFWRLAKTSEFAKKSAVIRIAGVGSQVYAALTITPMHDLMVTISFAFAVVAVISLVHSLYIRREVGLFVAGLVCLLVLLASGAIYYSGQFDSMLPWAQKAWLGLLATWMVSLDFCFPGRSRRTL